MSTITVVKKNGFAAIAADSLSSWGNNKDIADYIENHQKILHIADSYIAICGATSLKTVLLDYFSSIEEKVSLNNVPQIFKVWKDLHETLKDEYFLNPDEDEGDSFESTRMDVLIANPHGIFGVSAHRAVQEFSKFYAYGFGREFALGAMYLAFNDEKRAAEEIARSGVEAAAEFDNSTGLPITSYRVALIA
jgi:ATP-dependent HslUV protease, peptidase subunit HslV